MRDHMKKIMLLMFMAGMIGALTGCATLKEKFPMGVDSTAQAFFDDLQKSDNSAAYGLFAKGLAQSGFF